MSDLQHRKQERGRARPLLLVFICLAPLLLFPRASSAGDMIVAVVTGEPPLPKAVQHELIMIFRDTLAEVLFEGDGREQILGAEPETLAEAIRTGTNIVIESKGYTVSGLDLDLESTPVMAEFLVHPVGWTPEDPRAVTDVEVRLSERNIGAFWNERFTERLSGNLGDLTEVYAEWLVGLPTDAVDQQWSLDLVMPGLIENDPAFAPFPDFGIEHSVDIGPTAVVTLFLTPMRDVVELVRTRMYSRTLPSFLLDRLRERLLAEADFLEGMPTAEIEKLAEEIGLLLGERLERDTLARKVHAYASIRLTVSETEPVVVLDTVVESQVYDLELETFVDFGNESRDSAEVQGRIGVLLARGIEIFTNLNYFTNDNTLEMDIALGLSPVREVFLALGYDFEREAPKYFFGLDFAPGFRLRGEVFEDDTLNEFGLTYQFQQYLSAGFFTNADNEFWLRAIFTL